jgi:hypothetical protein
VKGTAPLNTGCFGVYQHAIRTISTAAIAL